ncbi:MAG TPA: hypothetical protein VIH99_00550 [Bdellovibrionota bacterium]
MSAFLALALLFSSAAQAEIQCASASALRPKVKECAQNGIYTEAAHSCVDRYESLIADSRSSLTQALERLALADKQSQAMTSAETAYDAVLDELKELAALGLRLQEAVSAYQQEVVLPEDFASLAGTGFSAKVFLDNNPCYRSTQDLIATYSKLLGSRAKELELTGKIAGQLKRKTLKGEKGLDASTILPMLSPGSVSSTAPNVKPVKHPPQKQSDITGTKKKKN